MVDDFHRSLKGITETKAFGTHDAASHLRLSQPAVPEAIANLAAALRVRSLDRSRRGVIGRFAGVSQLLWVCNRDNR
jgi:hypothetical protein